MSLFKDFHKSPLNTGLGYRHPTHNLEIGAYNSEGWTHDATVPAVKTIGTNWTLWTQDDHKTIVMQVIADKPYKLFLVKMLNGTTAVLFDIYSSNSESGTGSVAESAGINLATTALGFNCLYSFNYADTTYSQSDSNSGYGYKAFFNLIKGYANSGVGAFVGFSFDDASNNTGFGYAALAYIKGNRNTAFGASSLLSIDGYYSGGSNIGVLESCSSLGFRSIGGFFSGANGTMTNVTGVGAYAAATGDNQVVLGGIYNGTAAQTYTAGGTVHDISDIQDKADVRDTVLGLDFINRIRAVDYKWDLRRFYEKPIPDKIAGESDSDYSARIAPIIEGNKLCNIVRDGSKKRSRYHHGVIAQEVKAVLDDLGIDFGGYQDHTINGGDAAMTVGYSEFIAPLIKAVQELSKKLTDLTALVNNTAV